MAFDPLKNLPSSAAIAKRIKAVEEELSQLRRALAVVEAIENPQKPTAVVFCPDQQVPLAMDLQRAFSAGDFPGVLDVVRRAKAAGVRLKLNLPDGSVWDSELCEAPTLDDFEATGRDLAVKASATEAPAGAATE